MACKEIVLLALFVAAACAAPPPTPNWPDQFTATLLILVEQYGPQWNSSGALYYDWTAKTFRADYLGWCLPLFGSDLSSGEKSDYYSCSFLATEGSMFFVNHTADSWQDDQCCLFAEGIGAVPPDWMKNDQYNGTSVIHDIECDVWWFPGTSDPNKPCYGYWDSRDKTHAPVQFFGLSSIGPTILDYSDFKVGPPPRNVSLSLPNRDSCFKECQPPATRHRVVKSGAMTSPHFPWPSCE